MDQTYINMLFTIAMAIISGVLTLCGKYLNEYKEDLVKRTTDQDSKIIDIGVRIERLREDFNREALHVQRDFVAKDEYIAMVSKIDSKLDRTLSALHEVDKTLAQVVAKGEQNEQH